MPLGLSKWKTFRHNFTATSVDDLALKIKDYLLEVKWIHISDVTGGYKLFTRSPQNLEAYFYIRNLGHTAGVFPNAYQTLTMNWESIDGTITGMDLEIAYNTIPDEEYVLITGKSQFALAKVGVSADVHGSSLIVSIPFIPTEISCGGKRPVQGLITQCWISMGDFESAGSPRKYLILGSGTFAPEDQVSYEALWETDLCVGGSHIGSLRMPTLTYAPYIFNGFNFPSDNIWATHDFFRIEPFLAWGTSNSDDPMIRGQLWDCMIFAKPFAMDYTIQMDGYNWYVYTDNYLYGVLAFIDIDGGTGDEGVLYPGTTTEGNKLAAFIYD